MKLSTECWGTLSGVRAGLGTTELAILEQEADLETLQKTAAGRACIPLGHGTNLVGADEHTPTLGIKLAREGFGFIETQGTQIHAGCGQPLSALLRHCAHLGLGGYASLVGIPGTLGAALSGNVGANSHCIFECVQQIHGLSLTDGSSWQWNASDGGWSYRLSPVPRHVLVTDAILKLTPCDAAEELQAQAAELARRKATTPPYPTLGSTFKNPAGTSAGKLLEEAGCKGLACGPFQVSDHHANWIVNISRQPGAARDYAALLQQMQRRVKDHFGILLQPEVRFISAI